MAAVCSSGSARSLTLGLSGLGKEVMVKRDGITKCMRQRPALISIVTGALMSIFCDRGSRVTGAVMAIFPPSRQPGPGGFQKYSR